MKYCIFFIAFFLGIAANAQQFKRYQVKSGYVQYHTIRFSLHSELHTDTNGKIVSKSEQIPYVAEIRDYYWDDYGNISRDVIYKAADIGGKPLPEKEKIIERLWLDGRMYYLKNDKVAFDPDHLRDECMAKKSLLKKVGWFRLLYPNVKPMGKEKVAGKKGIRYYEDAFSEYVLWKGLILHNISFFTSRAGERKGEEREEIAIKIQTGIDFKPGFFYPLWYQKFTPYYLLDAPRITELLDGNPDLTKQAGDFGIIVHKEETVVYVTSDMKLGKLSVVDIAPKNSNQLTIIYETYNNDGSVASSDQLKIDTGFYCDLDSGRLCDKPFSGWDFQWQGKPFAILQQDKALEFYLIKSSIK